MTAAHAEWRGTMDGFIMRENIKHYLALLERTIDENERARISALLAEERRKQKNYEDVTRQFSRDLGPAILPRDSRQPASWKARPGQNAPPREARSR
jgi:hypothetical protein